MCVLSLTSASLSRIFQNVYKTVKARRVLHGKPSQNYTGCQIISLAARHKRAHPALAPVRPVLDLPTPEGWKAELT